MSDETVAVDSADYWPEGSEDVDEGIVANWFVRAGTRVDEGETLCEMQVEKVSVDVPAPASGEVSEILVDEGNDFTRGEPLARIRSA
ncbi:MAG: pyruvate/2-oxoglutarate dehydrogenase complex dihydrolipoamide acyltransferase (E2) component [Halobacteriales archaeon]|jgi:pyruvate/2-oxoglutarate dehydrogenase complex dihydrolipoamide acyltransferase (E2) component